jgi:hypothetical protein
MLKLATPMARVRPSSFQLHQRFEHRRQVHVLRRPVHQIEIDLIEPQLLQAGVERAADRVRREVLVPDLCGDVQILARDADAAMAAPIASSLPYISAVSIWR